jgi:hypothetical protein
MHRISLVIVFGVLVGGLACSGKMQPAPGEQNGNVPAGAAGGTSVAAAGSHGAYGSVGGAQSAAGSEAGASATIIGGAEAVEDAGFGPAMGAAGASDAADASASPVPVVANLAGAMSLCAAVPVGVRVTPTRAAFEQDVFGVWAACGTPSVFGTSNDVGLIILPDGHWHKLLPNGGLLAKPGFGIGNEGTWQILDTSAENGPGVFQLDFDIDGGGGIGTIPVLAQSEDRMHLSNNGVYAMDYVRIE